ncbi:MAG TPA: FHA domain-containing protein [Acidimicrobiales bacterium]|nr:FHA domain-containing protein [Acidimicrobiales bacterium]
MSEQLLNVFKVCLLIVLYLFFLRVLRAVWAELKEPKPAVAANPAPAVPAPAPVAPAKEPARSHLVVVAPEEQRGRSYELLDELTVGRAAGCHIALDDRFVSQLHARMFRSDDQCFLEDLGSTNGTFINDDKVTSPALLRKGDHVRIGNFVMELQ